MQPVELWDEQRQLADLDRLIAGLGRWVAECPDWEPCQRASSLWTRFEPRLRNLQLTLDRLLVVGLVGGTGVGKSTLINALVGRRVCVASDLQRPTTKRPVVLAAPNIDLAFLQFGDGEPEVYRLSLPLLENIILIDCPDPDTQGDHGAGGNHNRDVLRRVLPQCDVILHVGTAQKYKTHAVSEELLTHAPGRQVIFVQTHASQDQDIRADWQRHLEGLGFSVPRIFRLDSEQALAASEAGRSDSDLQTLLRYLNEQLGDRARHRIKRTSALDLVEWLLHSIDDELTGPRQALQALEAAIDEQSEKLTAQVRARLDESLRESQGLWRSRLMGQVAASWGRGPFALFLQAIGSFGALSRLATLGRARGLAPLAVAGTVAAGKVLTDRWKEAAVAEAWLQADLGVQSADIAQSRSVVDGYALNAGLRESRTPSPALAEPLTLAARQLHNQVDAAVDTAIRQRVARKAGRWMHFLLEVLFLLLPGAVIGRLGYNFFYEHHWLDRPLLGLEYAIQAALWCLLWGLLLRAWLVSRLYRGLRRDMHNLVQKLPLAGNVALIFSDTRQSAQTVARHAQALASLRAQAAALRRALGEVVETDLGRLQVK